MDLVQVQVLWRPGDGAIADAAPETRHAQALEQVLLRMYLLWSVSSCTSSPMTEAALAGNVMLGCSPDASCNQSRMW